MLQHGKSVQRRARGRGEGGSDLGLVCMRRHAEMDQTPPVCLAPTIPTEETWTMSHFLHKGKR